MFRIAYVIAVPMPDEAPIADAARIDGPYPMLSQAEYAARIWQSMEQDAEVVAAGRNGPWWVRVEDPAL